MHDTPATLETMSPRARWGLALFCVALGTYPILLATGIVEPDPGQLHAPPWVVGIAGGVFVLLGFYLPFSGSKVSNNLFGALICLSFAAMGAWVAFDSPPGSLPDVNTRCRRTCIPTRRSKCSWEFVCCATDSRRPASWATRK